MPSVAPPGDSYADATGARHPDVLFYDEPDDAKGTNNYLTIWTKAGPKATDYLEIWD